MGQSTALLRVAAALLILDGAGFGIFCIPAIVRLARHEEVPVVFGFPAYGGGPFERIGLKTSIPLLAAFLIINVLLVIAGVLVWSGARAGAILTFAMLVPGGFFWWGFALPFGPPLALASAAIVAVGWHRLG